MNKHNLTIAIILLLIEACMLNALTPNKNVSLRYTNELSYLHQNRWQIHTHTKPSTPKERRQALSQTITLIALLLLIWCSISLPALPIANITLAIMSRHLPNNLQILAAILYLPTAHAMTAQTAHTPTQTINTLLLLSVNIQGGWKTKIDEINTWIKKKQPTAVLFQEVKLISDLDLKYHENDIPGYKLYFNVRSEEEAKQDYLKRKTKKMKAKYKNRPEILSQALEQINRNKITRRGGVAIAIQNSLQSKINQIILAPNKRTITLHVKLPGITPLVYLTSVYAPTGNHSKTNKFVKQFHETITKWEELENAPTISGGDFNSYIDQGSDAIYLVQPLNPPTWSGIQELANSKSIDDTYRKCNPAGRDFTWENNNLFQRIDMFFTSKKLSNQINACKVSRKKPVTSDHQAISLQIHTHNSKIKNRGQQRNSCTKSNIPNKIKTGEALATEHKKYKETLKEKYLQSTLPEKVHLMSNTLCKQARLTLTNQIAESLANTMMEVAKDIYGETKPTILRQKYIYSKDVKQLRKEKSKISNAILAMQRLFITHTSISGKDWAIISKVTNQESTTDTIEQFTPDAVIEWIAKHKSVERKLGRRITSQVAKLEAENIRQQTKYLQQQGSKSNVNRKWFNKIKGGNSAFQKLEGVKYVNEEGKTKTATTQEDMETQSTKFWEKLWQSKKDKPRGKHIPRWFSPTLWKSSTISTDITKTLSSTVTYSEVNQILKKLANNKATGPDRIPQECYKFAPKCVKTALTAIFNTCIQTGDIPKAWKNGRIITLHKGGDTNQLANYRPITLLCTGYKIISSILTARIAKLAEETTIFSPAQAGCRKSNGCKYHTRSLINILEDSKAHNKEIHTIWIDIAKAFDSVPFWAINQILSNLQIPKDTIKLIMNLHTNSICDILVNQNITNHFEIKGGVRQGAPLSPLLFILFMEPLLRWLDDPKDAYTLAQNNNIRINTLAFVDDIVMVSNTHQGIKSKVQKIEMFMNYYGIHVNHNKSAYTYRAPQMYQSPRINNIPLKSIDKSKCYKYLGTMINLDLDWTKQLKHSEAAVTKLTRNIHRKAITTDQKIKCFNVLVNTKLAYQFNNIDFPDEWIKQVQSKITRTIHASIPISSKASQEFLWMRNRDGGRQLNNLQDIRSTCAIGSWYDYLSTTANPICRATTEQRLRDLQMTLNRPMMHFTDNLSSQAIKQLEPTFVYRVEAELHKLGISMSLNLISDIQYIKDHPNTKSLLECVGNRNTHLIAPLIREGYFTTEHISANHQINQWEWFQKHTTLSKDQYKKLCAHLCVRNSTLLSSFATTGTPPPPQVKPLNQATDDIANAHLPQSAIQRIYSNAPEHIFNDLFSVINNNTIIVFTDGSAINRTTCPQAGAGVFFKEGSDANKSFQVSGKQDNYNAELQAIEYAVAVTPFQYHVLVYSDSESSINAISSAQSWNETQWKAAANRSVLRRILRVIQWRNDHQFTTTIKYVPAHTGIIGNEAADQLAKIGCHLSTINTKPVQTQSPPVSISHKSEEIDANINRSIKDISYELTLNKAKNLPKRGRWYRLQINDRLSNKIFENHTLRSTKLKNFLTKARQELLAGRNQVYKYYNNTTPTSKKDIRNKAIYSNTTCLLCHQADETTIHIICECPNNKYYQEDATTQITQMIQNHTDNNVSNFPLWFHNNNTPQRINRDYSPKLHTLSQFDKTAGTLGFIPSALIPALVEFGMPKNKAHQTAIIAHHILVESIYQTYKARNNHHAKAHAKPPTINQARTPKKAPKHPANGTTQVLLLNKDNTTTKLYDLTIPNPHHPRNKPEATPLTESHTPQKKSKRLRPNNAGRLRPKKRKTNSNHKT